MLPTSAISSFLEFLSFPYFIGAFALGIVLCLILAPAPHVVMRFPSPHNAGKVTYQDDGGGQGSHEGCYRFQAERAECPSDPTRVVHVG